MRHTLLSPIALNNGEPAKENLWVYTRQPVSPDDYYAQNSLMNLIEARLWERLYPDYIDDTDAYDRIGKFLQNLGPVMEHPLTDDVMCYSMYMPEFQGDQ